MDFYEDGPLHSNFLFLEIANVLCLTLFFICHSLDHRFMISAVFQDVKEEASKYGQVISVVIPRPNIKKKVPSLSLCFISLYLYFFLR